MFNNPLNSKYPFSLQGYKLESQEFFTMHLKWNTFGLIYHQMKMKPEFHASTPDTYEMFFFQLKKDLEMQLECGEFVGLVNDPMVKESMENI